MGLIIDTLRADDCDLGINGEYEYHLELSWVISGFYLNNQTSLIKISLPMIISHHLKIK